MHHTWSVICSDFSIDTDSNNISLFKVLERIIFSVDENRATSLREEHGHLPVPVNFTIVTMWWRSDIDQSETGLSRLILQNPDELETVIAEQRIDLESHLRNRLIVQSDGIPFTRNGIYHFVVQIKVDDEWDTVAEIPLEVIQRTPAESNQAD